MLVVALDQALSLADSRAEAGLQRLTGSRPAGEDLPMNPVVLALVQRKVAAGRAAFLLAEDAETATRIVGRLGLFTGVILPDAATGETRLQAIRRVIGTGDFGFIGHDPADLPIWQAASLSWAVGARPALLRQTGAQALPGRDGVFSALWRGMRPHHWVKNLLVFLPMIAAHRWGDPASLAYGALAFAVFCLTSSAIYLANDLFDLADDRRHPHKRHRPLAAGQLGVGMACFAAVVFLLTALVLAATLAPSLAGLTALYICAALAYSRWLKTWRFVDLVSLAGLYTLRVLAGGAAMGIAVSGWLLGLSLLLFSALACAKRASELVLAQTAGASGIARRGYMPGDLRAVVALGGIAALGAGVVLIAYATETQTALLYARPWLLGLVALWLMLWVARIASKVVTGRFGTDPILFALRDPVSWAIIAAMTVTFVLAVA